MDPVVLENHPKKGIRILERQLKERSRWDGNPISETKQCNGCAFLNNIVSTRKTGHRLSQKCMDEIVGVCTWGSSWKIVWKSSNPRKCIKV